MLTISFFFLFFLYLLNSALSFLIIVKTTIECKGDQNIIDNKKTPKLRSKGETVKGWKAFTPKLCLAQVSLDRCSKHAWSDSEWQEKVQMRMIKLLSVNFILGGSPNECWPHTFDVCIIITWRLKLRATLVAQNKVLNDSPLHKSN